MLRAWLDCPALLIRMSTPPNVVTAHAPSSRASCGFVRSHVLLTAVPLSRWISATTCSRGSLRRPAMATRAPSAASMSAVARPMPEPAPVSSANLPSRHFMNSSVIGGCLGSAGAPRALGGWGAISGAPHVLGTGQSRGLGARALDLVDGLGRAGRQDLAAGGGDEHVVLDAHADAAELLRHRMGDLGRLGLLFLFELLGGRDAQAIAALPLLLLAVLAQRVGHALALGVDVEPGLDGEDHAGLERARGALHPVVADVVHVHAEPVAGAVQVELAIVVHGQRVGDAARQQREVDQADRKSTRLNSSHSQISYAAFCLTTKSNTTSQLA